jgi:hypothetical protein
MRKILMLAFLVSLSAPALAIYKCESDGNITYSDNPCGKGKSVKLEEATNSTPLPSDALKARHQAAREKNELKQIEKARQQQEAQEEKDRLKLARADAVKRKKCADLALQQKWAEEDANAASGKLAEKARRNARRKGEKFQLECGK